MLGTAELETITQDNRLPVAIEEIGQTRVRVRLTDRIPTLFGDRRGEIVGEGRMR